MFLVFFMFLKGGKRYRASRLSKYPYSQNAKIGMTEIYIGIKQPNRRGGEGGGGGNVGLFLALKGGVRVQGGGWRGGTGGSQKTLKSSKKVENQGNREKGTKQSPAKRGGVFARPLFLMFFHVF
jgi:hypothetical protein